MEHVFTGRHIRKEWERLGLVYVDPFIVASKIVAQWHSMKDDWDTPHFQARSSRDMLGAYTVACLESIAKKAEQNEPGAYKEKKMRQLTRMIGWGRKAMERRLERVRTRLEAVGIFLTPQVSATHECKA
jgi:hypothetical protein